MSAAEYPELDGARETHPAFGMARVNRHSVTPGAVLYDSEIRHVSTVVLTISRGERERHLNRDWLYGAKELIEIEMSEAQWGALVSSFGQGSGVPVTIRRTETEPRVPELPFEPRLALSTEETRNAAVKAVEEIKERADVVAEKPSKANIRALLLAIERVGPNVEYASKTLTEHVENVVTKAKHDIEAMVSRHAEVAGITSADVPKLELGSAAGSGTEVPR